MPARKVDVKVQCQRAGQEDLVFIQLGSAALRRDTIAGMLDTREINKIPNVENHVEIQRVREFIKARYPKADLSKLVIRFSSKKPMDIVVLGTKGGETKIIKDNGADFQKSFLNLTFVKSALGESFKQIQEKRDQEILKDTKKTG